MTDIQSHGKLYVRPLTLRNPRWNEIYYEAGGVPRGSNLASLLFFFKYIRLTIDL